MLPSGPLPMAGGMPAEVTSLLAVWVLTEHLLWGAQQDMNMGKATQKVVRVARHGYRERSAVVACRQGARALMAH